MATKKNKRRGIKIPHIKKPIIHNEAPGTVTYTGKKENVATKVEIIDYSKDRYHRVDSENIEDAFSFESSEHITWININGLNNTKEIERLGEYYNLHPLIQEDIVSTNQRPKMDEYPEYLYIVFKMLHYNENGDFINEHVSMVMGKDYVTTFQEADGDVWDGLRDRLENAKGRVRNAGADYLMFALLDAIVDNYFSVIETLSSKIEFIEDQLFDDDIEEDITQDIQILKKEILRIRRAVVPLREVINRLEKIDSDLIESKTQNYIRDLYDHIIQVSESVDIYREMIWGLMDMYMTTISNKMNEVMKVLTIMASIFIPLTFMAGIYGMNFEYIPELQFKYGYFVLWGAMILVFFGLLYYFKRKKWL
ncbi:magnesium transport protein CorA [Patiriisocius marinistellae]|uniref:Magnesium transport protein CorA n=1 Tax=Patiriisocius marinistellae TaxID=2494560 RepID=A0A5J4FW62_9FLAO|nr:magnesium/cobalt transporter CorA [Patiriisocius marinistellae]GEQ86340.1 magnesium transport protein CorA [Patiriisocius marinistellae]